MFSVKFYRVLFYSVLIHIYHQCQNLQQPDKLPSVFQATLPSIPSFTGRRSEKRTDRLEWQRAICATAPLQVPRVSLSSELGIAKITLLPLFSISEF